MTRVGLRGHTPTPDQDTLRTTESINGAIFTYSTHLRSLSSQVSSLVDLTEFFDKRIL